METKRGSPAPSRSTPKEPKSEKLSKKAKPKSKPSHPPVAKMVNRAIENLNNRGGSSVKAIKNYIAGNFVVDPDKVAPFIKKYLAKAVENNILVQTKGKGFTGSFKLVTSAPKKKEAVKPHHVTASGTTKGEMKVTKKTKKLVSKVKKPASKQSSREGTRKSVERKTSKSSCALEKVEKNKA